MDFLELLKPNKINLSQIFKDYKIDELKTYLNEITSNPKGYEELKNNPIAYEHFFAVLSQIFLIEDNSKQIKAGNEKVTLTMNLDKHFEDKVKELLHEQTAR